MPSTLSRLRQSALPRLVDRLAGSPLLWLLGVLRPKRALPAGIERVGILAFETIGDTLLASTLVASLRAAWPGVRIVVFASSGNAGVLPLVEGIETVVEVPLTRPLRAVRAVRSAAVDLAIDIGQWPRWYAVLSALSHSQYTIGFATPGQWRHFAYDCAVPHGDDVHELENFQRLLAPLPRVVPVPPARALKPVGPLPKAAHAKLPYVIVHPWASGFNFSAREWPLDRWVELIGRIEAAGRTVLISGSAADGARASELAARCAAGHVESVAGRWRLPELAAVVAHADAVVCVNTGIMHLAGLLDVPLVALHGPTSRRRWGPLGTRSIALAPGPGIRAEFLNLGFEYPGEPVDCMAAIQVEEVFAAVWTYLERKDV